MIRRILFVFFYYITSKNQLVVDSHHGWLVEFNEKSETYHYIYVRLYVYERNSAFLCMNSLNLTRTYFESIEMSSRLGDLHQACFSEYKLCYPQTSIAKAQSDFNVEWKKVVDVKKKLPKENEEEAAALLKKLKEERTRKKAVNISNFFQVSYFIVYVDNARIFYCYTSYDVS